MGEQRAQWYCVVVDHARFNRAANETFRRMVVDAFVEKGQPRSCNIYTKVNPAGGVDYYFSPTASLHFKEIIEFWGGVGVPEPTNLLQMETLI